VIRVERTKEPGSFDSKCRQPGKAWLNANPGRDPHRNPLWSQFRDQLREAFSLRCGFLAMRIQRGTVDHWLSVRTARDLSYEWSNYRFVDGAINSAKKPSWEGKLVDPFEVEADWFEILLPSLQLKLVADLEESLRARVEFTLDKLHLRDGEDVIQLRREWLKLYERKSLSLSGLYEVAPLIARAVAKRDGLTLDEL
jgi:hypothetical protein